MFPEEIKDLILDYCINERFEKLNAIFPKLSRLIYSFRTHSQMKEYRCFLKPEEAWEGCPKCGQSKSVLKLLCDDVICSQCYPNVDKCPVCFREIDSKAVKVGIGQDFILLPHDRKVEDLSQDIVNKYGVLRIADHPAFFYTWYRIRDETLDRFRGKYITLIGTFEIVRGSSSIPDDILKSILVFVSEGAGGRSYPWKEICKAVKLILPYYSVLPQLERVAKELIGQGYDIPNPE